MDLNPGGMLSPESYPSLSSGLEPDSTGTSREWDKDYDDSLDYSSVDSESFAFVMDGEHGRPVTDGGYDQGTMAEVEHTPPEWTGMENPEL